MGMNQFEISRHAKRVVNSWKTRLKGSIKLFSEAQQKAFLAEEVMSLIINFSYAEQVDGEAHLSASDIVAVYRKSLEMLFLDGSEQEKQSV
jgi:hypothetical protein